MENESELPEESESGPLNGNTPDNRPKIGGAFPFRASDNPKPFTKENQPTQEQREKAYKKRREKKNLRDKMKAILEMSFEFKGDSQVKKQLVEAFGERKVKKMTVLELMSMMQAIKAIKQGDTQAFSALLNQTLGSPKQTIGTQDKDGNDMPMQVPVLQVETVENFPIAESEEEDEEDDGSTDA